MRYSLRRLFRDDKIYFAGKRRRIKFLQLLAPFAPHIAEELWERLGCAGSITMAKWPEVDESKLVDAAVKMAVQVNGKLRGELELPAGTSKEDAILAAKQLENVKAFIDNKTIVKEICVPGKIVNIVVK